MLPSSFKNYSELLDLFISRERKLCPKIKEEVIILKKIGISLKMYDRLKREYMPGYQSKSSIIMRTYLETNFQHTFVHHKGVLQTMEIPPVPKTGRERRMEKRISHLASHVRLLEIENNYLRNRLKESNP